MSKLTISQKETIVELKQKGISSRVIASKLGCGKSTINDYFNSVKSKLQYKKPKILVFDLETAATISMSFGRFNINLSQSNILVEGGWILCACYKWLGEDDTYFIGLTPEEIEYQDDTNIVATLYSLFEQADAVVAHNAKKFDYKVLQTRSLFNGFGALPSVKVLDTLQMAKSKLKLPSNRLDSIGEYFGLGRKIDTGGITLWKEVQSGDEEAMQKMIEYCKQDVKLLEEVYYKIAAVTNAGTGFNAGMSYNDGKEHCSVCGSDDLSHTGKYVTTTLSKFSEVQCNNCGARHRTRQSSNTKEHRKTLLQAI